MTKELISRWRSVHIPRYFDRFFSDPFIDLILSHFSSVMARNGTLLDLGCDGGEKTESFRRMGLSVVGIDRNLEVITKADRRFPSCSFVGGCIEDLPFRSGSFDSVFSCSVMQYVDWRKATKECWRILKPDGRAVFVENLAENPFSVAFRAAHKTLGWKYPAFQTPVSHIRWEHLVEFKKVFRQVDFKTYNLVSPIVLVLPLLRKRIGDLVSAEKPKDELRMLHRIDRCLLSAFPFLSRHCWTIVIRMIK